VTNLTGEKGLVTIASYEAETGVSGTDCGIADPDSVIESVLVGQWTIANLTFNSAFGGDALGFTNNTLPDASTYLDEAPIRLQTFDPTYLTDSEVILLALTENGGKLPYETEIGPIHNPVTSLGGYSVCCGVRFIDTLEIPTSLPDYCFNCMGDEPVAAKNGNGDPIAEENETPIIPEMTAVKTDGQLLLSDARSPTAMVFQIWSARPRRHRSSSRGTVRPYPSLARP